MPAGPGADSNWYQEEVCTSCKAKAQDYDRLAAEVGRLKAINANDMRHHDEAEQRGIVKGMERAAEMLAAFHADDVPRFGCCDTWPKPCSYHEGWKDSLDRAEQKIRAEAASLPKHEREEIASLKERLDIAGTLLERGHDPCHGVISQLEREKAAHRCGIDPETVEALRRLRRTTSWIPLSREQLIIDADEVRARFRAMGVEL